MVLFVYFYYFMNLKKERGGGGRYPPPPHRPLHFLADLDSSQAARRNSEGAGLIAARPFSPGPSGG